MMMITVMMVIMMMMMIMMNPGERPKITHTHRVGRKKCLLLKR
jgi:hypothetical protein